LIQKMEAKLSD